MCSTATDGERYASPDFRAHCAPGRFILAKVMNQARRLPRIVLTCALLWVLAPLTACTAQQAYGAGQNWQRNHCNRIPDAMERTRCLQSAATSYREYQRQKAASGPARQDTP